MSNVCGGLVDQPDDVLPTKACGNSCLLFYEARMTVLDEGGVVVMLLIVPAQDMSSKVSVITSHPCMAERYLCKV